MLRITDIRETMPDGGAMLTLKLEGKLEGKWIAELRRAGKLCDWPPPRGIDSRRARRLPRKPKKSAGVLKCG
jgi:hypothetical protein